MSGLPADGNDRRVQIDGLRALALIGVLFVHFWHKDPVTEHVRVSLFFAVSGFLITHILYSAKRRGGRIRILNFYVRRMLRLFPALFILVLVGAWFDMEGFRTSALWHAAQLSNIRFVLTESFEPWVAAHLWSLNILEQFYLLWPLVIILLPLSRILTFTIAAFAALVFVRVNGDHLGLDGWTLNLVLAGDPIYFGCFAYFLQLHEPTRQVLRSAYAVVASLIVLAAPYFLWTGFGASESYRILIQPALAVLIVGAYHGYRGPLGAALGSKVAQFLSKISYGMFIYHLALWWLVTQYFPELFERGPRTFAVMSAVTIMAATLSWYLVEQPLSRLKDRFPVRTSTQPAPAGPAPATLATAPLP
jgi:peptidoglycan/LPS O-acetylase OafA/YrhL